jgi:hypothetical protein
MDMPIIGKPPDETELPEQLRQDACNAFNLLLQDGKIPEDMSYCFEKNAKGKVVVHMWRERHLFFNSDGIEIKESYGDCYTDPKDLIVAAGTLKRVRLVES